MCVGGSLETSSDRSVVYDLTNQRGGPCVNPQQANRIIDKESFSMITVVAKGQCHDHVPPRHSTENTSTEEVRRTSEYRASEVDKYNLALLTKLTILRSGNGTMNHKVPSHASDGSQSRLRLNIRPVCKAL